jgi:hypothetical protein
MKKRGRLKKWQNHSINHSVMLEPVATRCLSTRVRSFMIVMAWAGSVLPYHAAPA